MVISVSRNRRKDSQAVLSIRSQPCPWTTPWRIITMGRTPGVIVESTHGTDLAMAACHEDDFSAMSSPAGPPGAGR
ncbi:MAG: glycoside hydrolase family 97 N-terminal domain-containing protein [Marinilabiliales bacterium]|nr:glycoside hydrolase family 97 N-terminal domain-containing protein [Marinilabiliales bacterium]